MIEIELSYTWSNDDPTFAALAEEFSQQHGVKVRLRRLEWATAWVDLFTIASQGQGSDVSNIGSTWVSTLAKMDVLRPFKPGEVAEMGGESAFAAPIWESTKLVGDPHIWSIPWISWMYLLCYRRDVLRDIGIDSSKAFATPQAFQDTLAALKTSPLEIPWLNPEILPPYTEFIHTAASWVWAASKEFINSSGNQVLFATPDVISGLAYWLNTYRSVPDQYRRLSTPQCVDLFMRGRAAASLLHIQAANAILGADFTHFKPEHIGFANLTSAPWSGGNSFIIWDHTRVHPERERAAVELVKFMTTKAANLRWMNNANLLPARVDALHEGYPPDSPLHDVVTLAILQGRGYQNAPHWRRVETQLCLELGAVVKEAWENPAADSATILRNHLEPLARRLNIVLER
jgi:multiple sugar transport system substrate-binding protein